MAKKLFNSARTENTKSKLYRKAFNLFPVYRRTGGKITFISDDFKEMHVLLSLKLKTRNIVGSVFGGSIYSSTDPIYMAQLMQILGKSYIVWDKAATIDFKKPIYKKAKALFLISDELIKTIKDEVDQNGKYVFDLPVQYVSMDEQTIHAEISKTLYVASKSYYKQRPTEKQA